MSYTLLKSLVNQNSYSFNVNGLKAVNTLLQHAFDPLEGKKKIVGHTLFYTKRPRAPIQITLGGHYDTVYPPESPFQKLSRPKKGILKGPGVADMKGGLCILLSALLAFEKTKQAQSVGWRLFLNADEEIGSPHSAPLLETFSRGSQAAFLFEPALPDGSLVDRRKGSVNLTLTSQGIPAHAGRDLDKGKNALIPLIRIADGLQSEPGLNIAALKGGEPFNIVPHEAVLKLNYRSEKEKDFDHFLKKIQDLALKEKVELKIHSLRPPKPYDKKTQKLFSALGYPVSTHPSGGVCDGNLFSGWGIPTLDTLGAVGGGLHTPDEYIEEDSLKERAELFYHFLVRLSKGEVSLC
jgi:glutamate carboxypeptidase